MDISEAKIHATDVLFDTEVFAELIDWDDDRITVVISDVESKNGPIQIDNDVEMKIVSVRKTDLPDRPDIGDEIRLNLDIMKVDDGDYWRVEKVVDLELVYDIYFSRYVS